MLGQGLALHKLSNLFVEISICAALNRIVAHLPLLFLLKPNPREKEKTISREREIVGKTNGTIPFTLFLSLTRFLPFLFLILIFWIFC